MGNKQNIIELNGKKYDVVTGKLLSVPQKSTAAHHAVSKSNTSGTIMDGFVRKPIPPASPISHSRTQNVGSHALHTKTDRSRTLMRKTVPKPQTATQTSPNSQQNHQLKNKSVVVPHARVLRAKETSRSSLVSRYGLNQSKTSFVKAFIPVKEAPQPLPPHHAGQIQNSHKATSAAAPARHDHKVSTSSILRNAVENSTSHTEVYKPAKKQIFITKNISVSTRALSAGSLMVAGLVLGAFIMYQNVPNVRMRIATTRSGVKGNLPTYQPAGFSIGSSFKYDPGRIIIGFNSTSDKNRKFEITQTNSQWNSDSLLENFVATTKKPYQTYQDKGKTIYIYDGTNATWVDGGIWYRVEGNSQMSSNQLINLATSF